MRRLKRTILYCCLGILLSQSAYGQFGIGLTYGADLYQHHRNPDVPGDTLKHGVGSAIFNLNIGPKIWIGVKDFSFSIEGQLGFAPFALDINEYKGMGAFYFPFMAAINYRGLSTFREEGGWGCSLAAGSQFTKTDVYFIKEEYEDVQRDLYQTFFGQVNVGFGSKHTAIYAYVRYGAGDAEAQDWHIGIMLDFNLTKRSKLKKSIVEPQ